MITSLSKSLDLFIFAKFKKKNLNRVKVGFIYLYIFWINQKLYSFNTLPVSSSSIN